MRKQWMILALCVLGAGCFGIAGGSFIAQDSKEAAGSEAPAMAEQQSKTGRSALALESVAGVEPNVKFFRGLLDKGNADYADAYRLAFILNRETVGASEEGRLRLTFEQYRDALIHYGVIDSSWGSNPAELLTQQEAAYLFARAIRLDGGILWTATQTQRYAHRETVDRGLFPDVNPRQYISGAHVVSGYRTFKDYMLERAAAE